MNTSQLLKQAEQEALERWPAGLNPQCAIARYGFTAGVQYSITHLQAQKGERGWREIVCSDHLPEADKGNISEEYSIPITAISKDGESYYGYFHLPVNKFYYRQIDGKEEGCAINYMVSWLEPAPPLAPENEAVLFAEWLLANAEHRTTCPDWHYNGDRYTTQQLYTIFKQQK